MHLPRAPLISDDHLCISGNVTLALSAAIAPNVLLQADPGYQLIIGEGVSIGSGCILHAHGGTLEIEAGATLGSSVLLIGSGKVGANACIGSRATVINSNIAPEYAVPPGAVIGDQSRQDATNSSNSPTAAPSENPVKNPIEDSAPTVPEQNGSGNANANGKARTVHGQAYLERMMVMMFPHQQQLANQKLENPSPDD